MSPAKFTYEDIRSLITYRLSEGVPSSDVARDITALRVLCQFTENAAVDTCLRRYPQYKRLKYSAKQRLPTLADADITHIWETLGPIEDADYRHLRAYTLVLLSYYCGMRTKELRGLETSDVDLTNKLILIRHPKGEMTYGQQRTVPIHHDIVPYCGDGWERSLTVLFTLQSPPQMEDFQPILSERVKVLSRRRLANISTSGSAADPSDNPS